MSKPDRREILRRVAAGTISAGEAAAQLDAIAEPDDDPIAVQRVRVIRQFGNAEVVGDATVRDAVADGAHQARIEGDVMIIDGAYTDEPGSFIFGIPRHFAQNSLVVRMNPKLALDLRLQGGTIRVRGVDGPIQAEVQAGSATIDGFSKPINLSVQAGSVKAIGRLDEGQSRIACDAGSVTLHLEHGSQVRVKARAHMGKVSLPGPIEDAGLRGAQEVTVGDGTASLVVETSMGSVRVTADQ